MQQGIDHALRLAGLDTVLERQGLPVELGRLVVGCDCILETEWEGVDVRIRTGLVERVGVLEDNTKALHLHDVAEVHTNNLPKPLQLKHGKLSSGQLIVVHNSLRELALAKHIGLIPDLDSTYQSVNPSDADSFWHTGFLL